MFHRSVPSGYILLAFVLDLTGTLGALFLAKELRAALPFGQPFPGAIPVPLPDGSTLLVPGPLEIPLPLVALTLAIWSVVFFLLSVYDPHRLYKTGDELQRVLLATLFSLLVLAGALYFSYRMLSRLLFVYFYVLDLIFLIGWRLIARLVFQLGKAQSARARRVVVVGADALGHKVAETVQQHAWIGLQFVGFLDDGRNGTVANWPVLGSLDETRRVVQEKNIQEVIIALPHSAFEKLNQIVIDLLALPVQVRIVPDYLSLALYRATVEDFGGLPLINLRDPALSPYQRLIKRAFDLLVGSALMLLALPCMAIIAVIIKLDSPGPVLFKQQRAGENGRLFSIYKFRSMRVGAEETRVLRYDDAGHVIHKVPDDPRVTRVGRFLRRTSLDEIPQLFNVLKGDMSLVGPRPELPWLVEKYSPWQRKRFAVPQGMTGWWQINERANKPMHLHVEEDLYYIQNYSLWLDIRILWKTLPAVLKCKGAF